MFSYLLHSRKSAAAFFSPPPSRYLSLCYGFRRLASVLMLAGMTLPRTVQAQTNPQVPQGGSQTITTLGADTLSGFTLTANSPADSDLWEIRYYGTSTNTSGTVIANSNTDTSYVNLFASSPFRHTLAHGWSVSLSGIVQPLNNTGLTATGTALNSNGPSLPVPYVTLNVGAPLFATPTMGILGAQSYEVVYAQALHTTPQTYTYYSAYFDVSNSLAPTVKANFVPGFIGSSFGTESKNPQNPDLDTPSGVTAQPLDVIEAAGFRMLRIELIVKDLISSSTTPDDFFGAPKSDGHGGTVGNGLDTTLKALVDHHFIPVIVLNNSNPAISATAFADCAQKAVTRYMVSGYMISGINVVYNNVPIVWEIVNEPDQGPGYTSPSDYANLVNKVAIAMHTAFSGAIVVGDGSSSDGQDYGDIDVRYFDTTIETAHNSGYEMANYLDGFSKHPYAYNFIGPEYTIAPEQFTGPGYNTDATNLVVKHPGAHTTSVVHNYADLEAEIEQYHSGGTYLPLVNTEWGYVGSTFTVRQYLTSLLAHMPMNIYFKYNSIDFDFGLTSYNNYRLYTSNDFPRPALGHAQTLTKVLSGYRYVGRLPLSTANEPDATHDPAVDYVALFTNGSHYKLAVWSTKPSHAITLPIVDPSYNASQNPNGSVVVTTAAGLQLSPTTGSLNLSNFIYNTSAGNAVSITVMTGSDSNSPVLYIEVPSANRNLALGHW